MAAAKPAVAAKAAAAAAKPSPAAKPAAAAAKPAAAEKPALRRQNARADLLSKEPEEKAAPKATAVATKEPKAEAAEAEAEAEADAEAEGDTEEEDALRAAQEEAYAKQLRKAQFRQLAILSVILVVRVVLAFMKASHARGGGEGSPFDTINAMLLASPMGGLFKHVAEGWAFVAEFVKNPQNAPVMMVLLIVATRLVKRWDERAAAADEPVEVAEEDDE